jgi:hypothetical protein
MNHQSNAPVSPKSVQPAGAKIEREMAVVSLVLGEISLCGVLIPIIGILLGSIGFVLGYFGRKDDDGKIYAIVGMVLSGVGILLSCMPTGLISVMRLLGPKIGNTFSTISSSLP